MEYTVGQVISHLEISGAPMLWTPFVPCTQPPRGIELCRWSSGDPVNEKSPKDLILRPRVFLRSYFKFEYMVKVATLNPYTTHSKNTWRSTNDARTCGRSEIYPRSNDLVRKPKNIHSCWRLLIFITRYQQIQVKGITTSMVGFMVRQLHFRLL